MIHFFSFRIYFFSLFFVHCWNYVSCILISPKLQGEFFGSLRIALSKIPAESSFYFPFLTVYYLLSPSMPVYFLLTLTFNMKIHKHKLRLETRALQRVYIWSWKTSRSTTILDPLNLILGLTGFDAGLQNLEGTDYFSLYWLLGYIVLGPPYPK